MSSSQRSFFGYEPHWVTLDHLYVICLAGGAITGLRVGGQLYASAHRVGPWPEDPAWYAERELLVKYGLQEPWAIEVAFQDERNFQIPVADVAQAEIRLRRSWWIGRIPNSGRVRFQLRSGKRRRFILLGHQNPAEIHAALAWAGVPVAPLPARAAA